MTLLISGLLLFTGIHFFLSVAPGQARRLRERIGANGVKGLVALLSAAGLTLIVLGWRSAQPEWIYTPPAALRVPGMLLLVVAAYLFVVANRPSVIKRLLRHPQLTGVLLWSIGHLMLNGDSRSLLLFGWLGLWALAEMPMINRRDGIWIRSTAPGAIAELLTVLAAGVFCAFLVYAHSWFAGVPIFPGS